MKLLHLSDLHLGKTVHGFSMEQEQRYILSKICGIVSKEQPDAVLLAGDLYDRQQAPDYAIRLLDQFLSDLKNIRLDSGEPLQIFMISGNHDSAARISFGGALMDRSVHVSSPWRKGSVKPVKLRDTYGPVNFYLLPFVNRFQIQTAFDLTAGSWTDAFRVAVADMQVNPAERNVLVAHQFVTGGLQSGSEDSVGGLDNVDAEVFNDFDYVALGHIHAPQSVGRASIRYCGSPLKYTFAEAEQRKSVTVAELGEKGSPVQIQEVELKPEHDMVNLRGSFDELMRNGVNEEYTEDYVHITLTEKEPITNGASRLRQKYHRLMALEYSSSAGFSVTLPDTPRENQKQNPLELLDAFYQLKHRSPETGLPQPMSAAQREYAEQLLASIARNREQEDKQTAGEMNT